MSRWQIEPVKQSMHSGWEFFVLDGAGRPKFSAKCATKADAELAARKMEDVLATVVDILSYQV
jgi:hypothetical protein